MGVNRHAMTLEEASPAVTREDIEGELESFHAASFGWAMSCCAFDPQEAEEVLQTAYLKAIEGRARFNGHSSARTWFFSVVRLTAVERRRYRAVRRLALLRWWRASPAPCPPPTPEDASGGAEEQRLLRDCLARLSPRQSELLHLVFYQELTIEDAAGVLGISTGTARTHYERGKAQLRRLLAEGNEP